MPTASSCCSSGEPTLVCGGRCIDSCSSVWPILQPVSVDRSCSSRRTGVRLAPPVSRPLLTAPPPAHPRSCNQRRRRHCADDCGAGRAAEVRPPAAVRGRRQSRARQPRQVVLTLDLGLISTASHAFISSRPLAHAACHVFLGDHVNTTSMVWHANFGACNPDPRHARVTRTPPSPCHPNTTMPRLQNCGKFGGVASEVCHRRAALHLWYGLGLGGFQSKRRPVWHAPACNRAHKAGLHGRGSPTFFSFFSLRTTHPGLAFRGDAQALPSPPIPFPIRIACSLVPFEPPRSSCFSPFVFWLTEVYIPVPFIVSRVAYVPDCRRHPKPRGRTRRPAPRQHRYCWLRLCHAPGSRRVRQQTSSLSLTFSHAFLSTTPPPTCAA